MLEGSDGAEPLAAGGDGCSAVGSLLGGGPGPQLSRVSEASENILRREFFASSCCSSTPQPKGEPPICQGKSDGP